jgi:hypothetical protein
MTRELDAEVAEKVMGWRRVPDPAQSYGKDHYWAAPFDEENAWEWPIQYSGRDSDAVVEFLVQWEHFTMQISHCSVANPQESYWTCWLSRTWYEDVGNLFEEEEIEHDDSFTGQGPTVGVAICRAALAAVGNQKESN